MSAEDKSMTTQAVAELGKQAAEKTAEKTTESAASGGSGGFGVFERLMQTDNELAGKFARIAMQGNGDGIEVAEAKEAYDCSDGAAYCIRGVTRMAGVSEIPPAADVVIGVAKLARGGKQ